MGTEIERKFLLAEAPDWLRDHKAQRIEQGYLAIEEGEGAEVRVRRKDEDTVLTVKRGTGRTREEQEIDLSEAQIEALWPLTEDRRIAETRYLVPHDSFTIEVDVFEAGLAGTVMAEIEFESEAASEDFDPPAWLGEEVTGDSRYANETLAAHGPPQ